MESDPRYQELADQYEDWMALHEADEEELEDEEMGL